MLNKYDSMLLVLLSVFLLGGFTSTILAQGDTWTTKTPMPKARAMCSACEVDGIIYVIGGITSSSWPYAVKTVEAYDPTTDTWTKKADMPTARHCLATCCLNGKIYAIGGTNDPTNPEGTVARVEEYDPITDNWQSKTDMPTLRAYLVVCSVEGKLYAIGGMLNKVVQSAVEEYDPATDNWYSKTNMPTARNYLAASSVDRKIYVIGGTIGVSDVELSHNEAYDPVTDSWSTQKNMTTARLGLSASSVNGKVYAIGGSKNLYDAGLKTVEEYDPATDSWVSCTDMSTPRVWHTSCAVNGKIYVIGGTTDGLNTGAVATVEEYTPPMTGVSNDALDQTIPKEFKLYQNCPNPFNPTTLINYSIAKDSHVKIMVYNTLGQVVAVLMDGFQSQGSYNVKWDAHNQPSGLYIYRLEADGFSEARKMFLQK